MITTKDAAKLLAVCGGYAPDKTPQVTEMVLSAWTEAFEDFPHVTFDDARKALKLYFREPADRLVQPADVCALARRVHQDRSQRWTQDEEDDRNAFLEAKSAGRVGSPQEWAALKAANRNRLAELINPIAAGKGLNNTQGEIA